MFLIGALKEETFLWMMYILTLLVEFLSLRSRLGVKLLLFSRNTNLWSFPYNLEMHVKLLKEYQIVTDCLNELFISYLCTNFYWAHYQMGSFPQPRGSSVSKQMSSTTSNYWEKWQCFKKIGRFWLSFSIT